MPTQLGKLQSRLHALRMNFGSRRRWQPMPLQRAKVLHQAEQLQACCLIGRCFVQSFEDQSPPRHEAVCSQMSRWYILRVKVSRMHWLQVFCSQHCEGTRKWCSPGWMCGWRADDADTHLCWSVPPPLQMRVLLAGSLQCSNFMTPTWCFSAVRCLLTQTMYRCLPNIARFGCQDYLCLGGCLPSGLDESASKLPLDNMQKSFLRGGSTSQQFGSQH